MKPNSLILILIAVGCGLLAAILSSQLAKPPAADDASPVVDGDLVRVVVARERLQPGDRITDPDKVLKFIHYRKGDEPKGFHSNVAFYQDRVLARPVNVDQPVKDEDLERP